MSQPNILIVDDTPANLKLLVALLMEEGYRVRPVLNGELALRTAREAKPDLVLLDIDMPVMDGYEVARNFKSDNVLSDVPIIFVSSQGAPLDSARTHAAGGVDFIVKPVELDDVLQKVRTHLRTQENA